MNRNDDANCRLPSLLWATRRRGGHRLTLLVGLAVLTGLLAACASGPPTGVRAAFEENNISSVAIAPLYSSSAFGMEPDHYEAINDQYEQAVIDTLEAQGFHVFDSRALRHHLTEQDLWDDFQDGIRLRQALTNYFEAAPSGERHPIEVRTLRELFSQGALPVDTLLFGEIVYHTQGTCQKEADNYSSYAELLITSAAPADLPRPCVSSHFQAKLVDAQTGDTMWFNRTFIETHTQALDDDAVRENIARTIDATINADGGIEPLSPPEPDEVLADID